MAPVPQRAVGAAQGDGDPSSLCYMRQPQKKQPVCLSPAQGTATLLWLLHSCVPSRAYTAPCTTVTQRCPSARRAGTGLSAAGGRAMPMACAWEMSRCPELHMVAAEKKKKSFLGSCELCKASCVHGCREGKPEGKRFYLYQGV